MVNINLYKECKQCDFSDLEMDVVHKEDGTTDHTIRCKHEDVCWIVRVGDEDV